jgi:N-methylhydantoinase B
VADQALNVIEKQILWNRLIAIVEEQAQMLMRTAFNPIVRECGDLSAGLFDLKGRMIAQAVTGTPGHVNTMAEGVRHFLKEYPGAGMHPEDIYLTNDPWKAAGHLNDFMLVRPCFLDGALVGYSSCTSHLADLGGLGFGPDGTDVLDEGLFVPIFKLVDAGKLDQTFMTLLRANSRVPIEVEGDTYALIACVECGSRRTAECMADLGIAALDEISDHIIETSRRRTNELIRALPEGVYRDTMRIDGYDEPLDLVATMTIRDGAIEVDFAGSSRPSRKGINCTLSYATAYSSFALRCAVAPDIPNNQGSLEPFRIKAPDDSIVNARYPAPVAMRHVVGQLLPDVVFGCLHQAVPGLVPAEGASCMWDLPLRGGYSAAQGFDKTRFATELVHNGGTGARPSKDGLSATSFPSGVLGSLVEITESVSPVIIWRRELRPDSGGAGRFRGGLGQVLELSSSEDAPISLFAALDRINHPARGREGGSNGAAGVLELSDSGHLRPKGEQVIPAGERLIVLTPGGAGYGNPLDRDPASVAQDVCAGLVSGECAEAEYGVVMQEDGRFSESHARRARREAAA